MAQVNEKAQAVGELAAKNDHNTYKISFEELDKMLRRAGKFTKYDYPKKGQTDIWNYPEQQEYITGDVRFYAIKFLEKDFEGDIKLAFYLKSNAPSTGYTTDHSSVSFKGTFVIEPPDQGKFFVSNEKVAGGGRSRRKKLKNRKTRNRRRR